MKKSHVAFFIFLIALLYIIAPYFFEKNFFLNEILALTGFLLFAYKGFRIDRSRIVVLVLILVSVCLAHAAVSIFRADGYYYYFRNLVIAYSMFTFFLGYFLFPYLVPFLKRFGKFIRVYVLIFLIIPVTIFFDRFGMSVLFPIFVRRLKKDYVLLLLALLSTIYSINYESSTILILSGFYLFIYFCRDFRLFKLAMSLSVFFFVSLFIYLSPYLSIDPQLHSHYTTTAIWEIIRSHPILEIDPNSTWRLVIWKQIIVDLFPKNILGIGFGTPALTYYPIEDYSKLDLLPYVLGAHNSFVYLFGRLGIAFVIIITLIYAKVFREFFIHRDYYYLNGGIMVFFAFFAVSSVAIFNPVLETPIYASSYWLFLGFLARVISIREMNL